MISTIVQSSMIFILIVIVSMMMLRISQLQGTARVIGGDEFMAVIYNASSEKINKINIKLDEEVKRFNKLNHNGDHLDINYAHGCAFSVDYNQCTFMTLFNRADKNMYKDKMRSKNMEKRINK